MDPNDKNPIEWPYDIDYRGLDEISTDVLVLGGGIAGCWASIGAVRNGAEVVMIEKGASQTSGAGGSGCDHWEAAATNPCSKISPEELTDAMIRAHSGYNNGISHYIECREGWDRLVDLERMGGKIRDTDGEFKGAEFRDEKTGLLFAYDYKNRFTIRVWGSTFKKALYKECKKSGVKIFDRNMAVSLLISDGENGRKVTGVLSINTRTGKRTVFRAKSVILCMSRPTRMWLFSPDKPGISEFRPPQCTGDGHAMGWEAGVEFTMMEKSVRAEWSGTRSFPPYGTGNNHNTWYACSMVDAAGREIPWINRDGKILENISQRYYPAEGQRLYFKGGGEPDFPVYEFLGPDTIPTEKLLEMGYKLPFYADLPSMPEHERRIIWGMMIGNEGKTEIPILKNYSEAGFDPDKDMLQSYGDGWRSAKFQPDERQLFGLPGGMMNDWKLQTNIEGLFAAGDILFASNCHGHAAATGHYAGRHAADFAKDEIIRDYDKNIVKTKSEKIFSLLEKKNSETVSWRDLNVKITQIMQEHCGEIKIGELLKTGLKKLEELKRNEVSRLYASNPHELTRNLEVLNILTNAELVTQSCLARKASSEELHFNRTDYPEQDPPEWKKFIMVRNDNGTVKTDAIPLDYYGNLKDKYEELNSDYIKNSKDE
ncbi:FAD-dependent oxidoreductase [candidate division KSB1 bacterium]